MTYALTILNQLISMAIYALIGYVFHAVNLIGKEGNRAFSMLLLYILLPSVIVNSFFREASPELTRSLLLALAAGAALVALSMLVSAILFRKNPVANFSSSFSNAGFMGIPLILSVLDAQSVFYIAGFVALLNILQWTYGQRILSGKSSDGGMLKALVNPLVIAFGIGLICYFAQIQLPKQISGCISALANCNTPIAMIILGYYLRELPLKKVFTMREAYFVAASRLILIPLLSLLLLAWIPWIDHEIKLALLIAAFAPVGTNVAIYAQKHDAGCDRAVAMICLTTILSVFTMPLMILLTGAIIG